MVMESRSFILVTEILSKKEILVTRMQCRWGTDSGVERGQLKKLFYRQSCRPDTSLFFGPCGLETCASLKVETIAESQETIVSDLP